MSVKYENAELVEDFRKYWKIYLLGPLYNKYRLQH